jgi:hypothetical protein
VRKRKSIDLSFIYAIDRDVGKERHGELPPEIMHHFAIAFAQAAGLGPDSGFHEGPAPKEHENEDEDKSGGNLMSKPKETTS